MLENKILFARKIKIARKRLNLTQAELAEKIGISSKQLSRIESGSYIPSLPTFLGLLSTLKLDISEFGVNVTTKKNPIREKFYKLISSSTDSELEFCYKIVETMLNNFKIIKKDRF